MIEGYDLEFGDLLEDISTCFLQRDFDTWRRRLCLPFSLVARDGPVLLTTEKDVQDNFDRYLAVTDKMRLSLISRRPVSLEDCKDGTWLGTYETRLIAQNQLATAPYTSTALLTWEAEMFKMISVFNGRDHHEWTGHMLMDLGPKAAE